MALENNLSGWVGVDLDGCVAEFDYWRGIEHIGPPVLPMLEKVKALLAVGWTVKIFTARVCDPATSRQAAKVIQQWCLTYIGQKLEVTNEKDYHLAYYFDDRAIQVEHNTGKLIGTDS